MLFIKTIKRSCFLIMKDYPIKSSRPEFFKVTLNLIIEIGFSSLLSSSHFLVPCFSNNGKQRPIQPYLFVCVVYA